MQNYVSLKPVECVIALSSVYQVALQYTLHDETWTQHSEH